MGDLTHISTFIYSMLIVIASICVLACICAYIGHVYQQYQWNREDKRASLDDTLQYHINQYNKRAYTYNNNNIITLTDITNQFDLSDIDHDTYTQDMQDMYMGEYEAWVDSMEAQAA